VTSGTTVSAPNPAETVESARSSSATPPRDFAELAKRISGRTTDLFAVALMVLVLLYMGTRVMEWWRAAPPTVAAGPIGDAALAIWDDPANLAVEFHGGPWQLSRSSSTGTAEDVTRAAIEHARRTLETSEPAELPPPDAAEHQWLEQLRDWPPQVRTDRGDVFVLGGPWPWIVATQRARQIGPESREGSHAADSERVICWACALPHSNLNWTLYTAVRGDGATTSASAVDVPIPGNAQRLLTARSPSGGVTSFSSHVAVRRVSKEWDRELQTAGWTPISDWSGDTRITRATYRRKRSEGIDRLDAAVMQGDDGVVSGIADWHRE